MQQHKNDRLQNEVCKNVFYKDIYGNVSLLKENLNPFAKMNSYMQIQINKLNVNHYISPLKKVLAVN